MNKQGITRVVKFLSNYRGAGCWGINIEKELTNLLASIDLIEKAQSLVVLGYTKDDIKSILGM